MSGNVSLDVNGLDLAFLRIDSDLRLSTLEAVRERLRPKSIEISDDRQTHLVIAQFIDQIEDPETLVRELSECFIRERVDHVHLSPIVERLIEARETYEKFFNAQPRWRVPGWSPDLVTLAADLYLRSDLEIAVTVWHFDRAVAEVQSPTSMLRAPQVEFDHNILGAGRYVPLSKNLVKDEPFFETEFPVAGVCGVTCAWMYIAPEVVDQFSAEIAAYMLAEMPEAASFLADIEKPIEDRPFGPEATGYIAEAFARHLTIREAAESICNRFLKTLNQLSDAQKEFLEEELLEKYLSEVLETGALCRPASIDASGVQANALNLSKRLRESYFRRESVFVAWARYIDYAKTCGVWVHDLSSECGQARSLFEKRYPGLIFNAQLLRECISGLIKGLSPPAIIDQLVLPEYTDPFAGRAERIIRVFGPSSPAIVISERKRL